MKQTRRAKDVPDRFYLRQLLAAQGMQLEPDTPNQPDDPLTRLWQRLKSWWGRRPSP
jgi:hypothetical protein